METFQAAGVVSRELESHYVGRVGLFKNQPGDVVVAHADVLVTIGYDPVEYDPRLWNAKASRTVIHIDSIPAQMDNHYQPTAELRGDVASTVETLTRLIEGLELSEEFASTVGAQRQALTEIDQVAARGAHGPAGLNPAAVVLKLRANLDDDATVAVGRPSAAAWVLLAMTPRYWLDRRSSRAHPSPSASRITVSLT